MSTTDRERVAEWIAEITDEVESWPHVSSGEHRFGGTEFHVGPREFGHVHRFGLVDVAFPRDVRDRLVEEGRTGPHHVYPESGWTTLRVEREADVDRARWVLRFAYLLRANELRRTPGGRDELADVDVSTGLDELDASPELRAAFESRPG